MKKVVGEIIERVFINSNYLLKIGVKEKINFIPGQFVNIEVDGVVRSYSIASLPDEEFLLFYIKRVPNGILSNKLATISLGSKVHLYGPFGHMTVDKIFKNKVYFVAAGTGIAPVRPMVYWLYKNKPNVERFVIHQEKHEKYLVFKDDFERWATDYIPIISRQEDTQYLKGHFQDYIHKFVDMDANYVLIGSANFVINIYKLLQDMKIPRENMILESFGNI